MHESLTIPKDLLDALTRYPSMVVVGHVTPDVDCLASMYALALGLARTTGRSVPCSLPPGSISRRLEFLTQWGEPTVATSEQCRKAECYAICDTAKASRSNLPDHLNREIHEKRHVIVIDHHDSNVGYGHVNWIDGQACSTAEMIYRLFRSAKWEITPAIASMLYAGIYSDSVGFSLPTSSHAAFLAAADLVKCGAEVGRVGEYLCRSYSEHEFQLRRLVYDNTRWDPSRRIIYSCANHDEIARVGCHAADVEDQVEIPRQLEGARVAMLFTEGVPGKIRINLRGKGDQAVLEIAKQLGGGGHHAAAGAILDGPLEDVVQHVLDVANTFLDTHPSAHRSPQT